MTQQQDDRPWQQDAFAQYIADLPENFLLVACPGAGKTRWAVKVIGSLVGSKVARAVVVIPTAPLKKQWVRAAHRLGVNLTAEWDVSQGIEPKGLHGVVVTYQHFLNSYNRNMHRKLAYEHDTLYVFDEIHHAALKRPWGDGIAYAAEFARHRLSLSGTPFRSDDNRIPFIKYEESPGGWRSKADFSFSYADALQQGVCRPILFPSQNARIEFMKRGQLIQVTFKETLSEDDQSYILRTALDPRHSWLRDLLYEADQELNLVRQEEQPDAGGLVVAMDREHAEAIVRLLEKISGERPVLAVSDMPDDVDPLDEIERFSEGNQKWLVAVRLVSEGVDIPRLAVGVYATNIVSELFFRQFVGRFVRMRRGFTDQQARLYIPEDQRIARYALEIKEERDHALQQAEDKRSHQAGENGQSSSDRKSIGAFPEPGALFSDGKSIPPEELARAAQHCAQIGVPTPSKKVLEVIALSLRVRLNQQLAEESQDANEEPMAFRIKQLRNETSTMGRLLAMMRQSRMGGDQQKHFEKVFGKLKEIQGVSQANAGEQELIERKQILARWIDEEQEQGHD